MFRFFQFKMRRQVVLLIIASEQQNQLLVTTSFGQPVSGGSHPRNGTPSLRTTQSVPAPL